jgi:hypothetical protein
METNKTQVQTETKKAKLIFKLGKWNEKMNTEEDRFISKLDGKIVYADTKKFDIKTRVSYTCEIRLSYKGKAYDVMSAVKTPVIKLNLAFKLGDKKYNNETNDYKQNWVSSFDGEIVLADTKIFNIEPQKLYSCEIVLSPQGKAYIVEHLTNT